MIRRCDAQLSLTQFLLFAAGLPEPEQLMDPVLRRVDALLDDDALVDEVLGVLRQRSPQSARRGPYGTPAEVVLRRLTLKHLRRWGYEELCREVNGSLVYRRFCRLAAAKVPDDKTWVRRGQFVAGPTLQALFDRVVAQAVAQGVTRGAKLRLDTTVVEAPIRHPTDSRLCEEVVRVLGRALRRLAAAGVALPSKLRDVRRSVGRRLREITRALHRQGRAAKQQALVRPYRRLLRITGRVIRQARAAAAAVRAQLPRLRGRRRRLAARTLQFLLQMVPRAQQVVRQTRARVLRNPTRADGKLVSVFEPYAQLLRRGKPHCPTEFGLLVKVAETEGGIVSDVGLVPEKADAPLLAPTVEHQCEVCGRPPTLVATDRGFHSTRGEARLRELGVAHAVIPKPGYRSPPRIAHERQRWFRRGRAWRAGGEARIGHRKNTFGMGRSRYRGERGLERTVLWAALANNLTAIGRAQ